MNRSDIKKTPGRIVYQSISLLAKLGTFIESAPVLETFEVGTDAGGPLGKRWKEAHDRIKVTPDGRFTSGIAAVLFPYLNPTIGTGIFNDTDRPLVIHGTDASLETYAAAALEEMPMITFSSIETLIGPATFLCLRGNGVNWSAANSLVTQADSGGTATDTSFAPTGIVTQGYVLNAQTLTGFSDIDTFDGIRLEPKVDYSDDTTDRHGLVNRRIKSVGIRLRFIPVGPTRQNIMAALKIQGSGAGRGSTLSTYSVDIEGDNGTVYCNLPNATFVSQAQRWGSEQTRIGECAFECVRNVTSGAPGAIATMLPV